MILVISVASTSAQQGGPNTSRPGIPEPPRPGAQPGTPTIPQPNIPRPNISQPNIPTGSSIPNPAIPGNPGQPSIPQPNIPATTGPSFPKPDIPQMPEHATPDIEMPQLQDVYSCSACNKEVSEADTKCPHCGVRFDYVENEDGSRTEIPGSPGERAAQIGIGVLVFLGLGLKFFLRR